MLGGGHFAGAIFKGAEVRNFVNFNLCILALFYFGIFIKFNKIDVLSFTGIFYIFIRKRL
jgi:hypothetical protein